MKSSYKIIVKGLVQGVYYRKTIHQNANKMHIKGYVKNLANKDVEVVALLSNEEYEPFMQMLKNGSPYSKVEKLIVSKCDETYKDFSIKY